MGCAGGWFRRSVHMRLAPAAALTLLAVLAAPFCAPSARCCAGESPAKNLSRVNPSGATPLRSSSQSSRAQVLRPTQSQLALR